MKGKAPVHHSLLVCLIFEFVVVGHEAFSPNRRKCTESSASNHTRPCESWAQQHRQTTGQQQHPQHYLLPYNCWSTQHDDALSIRLGAQVKGSYSARDNDSLSFFGRVQRAMKYPVRKVGEMLFRPRQEEQQATTFEQSAPKPFELPWLKRTRHETVKDSDDPIGAAEFGQGEDEPSLSRPNVSSSGRTATATVDLTGTWDLVVTDNFKTEYDKYLMMLGQPYLVRSVAVNIVSLTSEETEQKDHGRSLFIRGRNVRGIWERTLITSGPEKGKDPDDFKPIFTSIMTADYEEVQAEAWWEDKGTVHRSWLRGVTKYGGGSFESKRYLEDGGNILVCESIFHPIDKKKEKATITWRFERQKTP